MPPKAVWDASKEFRGLRDMGFPFTYSAEDKDVSITLLSYPVTQDQTNLFSCVAKHLEAHFGNESGSRVLNRKQFTANAVK
jgi:hypothetical protein